MKKTLVVGLLCTSLMAGCTTLDPYTQQQKTSDTAKGAGFGALGGALLGAAVSSDHRGRGAVVGALLGTAVGGGIGNYMDRQEAVLRQQLQNTGVSVQRMGDSIRLIMPGNITFATDSTRVAQSFYPVLDSVGQVLTKFDKTMVEVDGFTDSTGSFEYNQKLSEQRAQAVAGYLQQRGISGLRLSTRGYGERDPIADNSTVGGRALNRRVEIRIRGTQQ